MFAVVPGEPGSSTTVAGSLASRITFPARPPPTAASSAILDSPGASNELLPGADLSESVKEGKRKVTEDMGDDRQGKRVKIANRSQLERELLEAQSKASVYREAAKASREKVEAEEAREKWLQQQLGSSNIE